MSGGKLSLESLEQTVKDLQKLIQEEIKQKERYENEVKQLRQELKQMEEFVKNELKHVKEISPKEEDEYSDSLSYEEDEGEEDDYDLDLSNKEVVMEGWLEKKADFRNVWRMRYMKLFSGGPLLYFEDDEVEEPSGVIHLENGRLFPHAEKNGIPRPLCFNIRYGNQDFLLRAASLEQKEQWCQSVASNIKQVASVPPQPSGSIFTTGNISDILKNDGKKKKSPPTWKKLRKTASSEEEMELISTKDLENEEDSS